MSALPELPHTNYFKAFSQGVSLAYTGSQLIEYGDARAAHARKAALEEAAKFLEKGDISTLKDNQELLVYTTHLMLGLARNIRSLE